MILLAEENVHWEIIERLRTDGHAVTSIAEESPSLPDPDVLLRACQAGVVLLTGDKDFGELVHRHRRAHAGVLLMRLAGIDNSEKCELVSRTIAEHGASLPGAFSVLTAHDLRIRRPPASQT